MCILPANSDHTFFRFAPQGNNNGGGYRGSKHDRNNGPVHHDGVGYQKNHAAMDEPRAPRKYNHQPDESSAHAPATINTSSSATSTSSNATDHTRPDQSPDQSSTPPSSDGGGSSSSVNAPAQPVQPPSQTQAQQQPQPPSQPPPTPQLCAEMQKLAVWKIPTTLRVFNESLSVCRFIKLDYVYPPPLPLVLTLYIIHPRVDIVDVRRKWVGVQHDGLLKTKNSREIVVEKWEGKKARAKIIHVNVRSKRRLTSAKDGQKRRKSDWMMMFVINIRVWMLRKWSCKYIVLVCVYACMSDCSPYYFSLVCKS